ncbi:MAG: class III extradiol ring-cleavage dioxygenase [Alphaproteobacteria bacterium]
MSLPALFISHGSPMTAIEPSPTHHFLKRLGKELPKPKAILCVSAHWETEKPRLTMARNPELIYDFHGFPKALSTVKYPAPGSPELAARVATLLAKAGIASVLDAQRGLDHGCWDPLYLMYPAADVPVVQLSIQPNESADHHLAVGRALAALRDEDVLVMGSGNATHNLAAWRGSGAAPPGWVTAFSRWLDGAVLARDTESLAKYRDVAPYARENHPTEDHYLPLLPAIAAGGEARKIHEGYDGPLDMAAYAFG